MTMKRTQTTHTEKTMASWTEPVLVIGVVGLIVALSVGMLIKFSNPIEVQLPNLQMTSANGELEEFMIVAKRFRANRQYIPDVYNCINYSKDLKDIADELGFNTKVMYGCPADNGTCHEWLRLEVDFEPQSGAITDYSDDYPNFVKEVR